MDSGIVAAGDCASPQELAHVVRHLNQSVEPAGSRPSTGCQHLRPERVRGESAHMASVHDVWSIAMPRQGRCRGLLENRESSVTSCPTIPVLKLGLFPLVLIPSLVHQGST